MANHDRRHARSGGCLLAAALALRPATISGLGMGLIPKLQVKPGCYSPNSIEQTAHCDHKPRAAWVFVRLLLHRRSAAGWAGCMIYSALVSFFWSLYYAEGDVSAGFCAGVAGLGCVPPRGPGSGESAVAHKGSLPLLSGVERGGWSRGAWLLALWAR